MSPMSRVSIGLQAVVLALVFVIGTAPTGVQAQGRVNMQKLSALLANELVGEAVASCAEKGYAVRAVGGALGGARYARLRRRGPRTHVLDGAFQNTHAAPA